MSSPSEQTEAVFNEVVELRAEQRAAFLDQACAGNPALRERIERLLRAEAGAGGFLETPAPGVPAVASTLRSAAPFPVEHAGDWIGRYQLIEQIGEGGCGVVYQVEQQEPVRRQAALKIIKLGMDTASVIARFEAERQALALMDHPHIAKVFDAGATAAGRPFFVMELVRGTKITEYCDENRLNTVARLRLFVQICQALQHAHQKGIIHRDIKPSNILVTTHDGAGVPKVIDFGIAKATQGRLTDHTLFTAFEQFLGTPAYMSPEQAALSNLDIDTRSDIYSLGVLLYELLSGKTPFESGQLATVGLDEMRRTILEKEPARPSTRLRAMGEDELERMARQRQTEPPKLIHLVRGDLDWIVMKCLEKDRGRRYETANGLAMDVQRHLSDEPVAARPPGTMYQLHKLVRRHRLAVTAALFVSAALLVGLGIATVAAIRLKRADHQIRQAKDDATESLRSAYLAEARALRTSSQTSRRFASLEAVRKAAAIRPDIEARNEAIASLAVSGLRVSKEAILKGYPANDLVAFDFNLEKYAVREGDGGLSIRAVTNDAVLAVLPAPAFKVHRILGFSPDSQYLRVAYRGAAGDYSDWVWDLRAQKAVLKEMPGGLPSGMPGDLAGNLADNFSQDSCRLARCHLDGTLSIYELPSGKELKHFSGGRIFNYLILNPGNTRLACASEADPAVEIREMDAGMKVATLACPAGVSCLAWSPDGKRLATGCLDFRIYIWNAETGRREAVLEGPIGQITALAFDHAGNLLANSSWDGVIRLWNADNGSQLASHPGGSWQIQFSADDRQLLGWQYAAHFGALEVADSREFRRLYLPRSTIVGSGISCPNFSADGRILAATGGEAVRFWDTYSGQTIASLPVSCDTHIFQPDGQGLIVMDWIKGACRRGLAQLGGLDSPAYRLGNAQSLYDGAGLYQGALSRDGRHLVFAKSEAEFLVLDLSKPAAKPIVLRPDPPVADRTAISPDGHWVTTSSWRNSLVQIWDARSGDLVRTISLPARALTAFSPDGHWLATSATEYQLWEVGTWRPKGPPTPGCDIPQWNFIAFSPDGRLMARSMDGTKIQLLETSTERPLATLEGPDNIALGQFQFSPDGSHLAVMQNDVQVQLWDLRLIRQDLQAMHLDWDMPPYPPIELSAKTSPVTLEIESPPELHAKDGPVR